MGVKLKRKVQENMNRDKLILKLIVLIPIISITLGCSLESQEVFKTEAVAQESALVSTESQQTEIVLEEIITPDMDSPKAEITSVGVSGDPEEYRFSVEIRSPDLGCSQYADWWEVISEDGELLYRRILLHSHVEEQPFKRSGGPVPISADQKVIVRAHMHPSGYFEEVLIGSVDAGFEKVKMESNFANDLEDAQPLPDGCAF